MVTKKSAISTKIAEARNISTVIEMQSNFIGTLEFERPLQIKGKFQGEIISNGILLIEETASIKANIKAAIVVLGGEVTGNIDATDRVEMLASGRLYGNVRTPKLQISDGVVFDGNCEMVYPQEK